MDMYTMEALVEDTVNVNRSSPLSNSDRIRTNGGVVFTTNSSMRPDFTLEDVVRRCGIIKNESSGSPTSQAIQMSGGGTVSIVHVALPNHVQSVIQPGPNQQQSVIQAPSNTNLQPVQLIHAKLDNNGDLSDNDTKKRREVLARRPSYRKILNDLSDPSINSEMKDDTTSSGNEASSQESDSTGAIIVGGQYHSGLLKVLPGSALQLGTAGQEASLQQLAQSGGGTLVQYANQDGQQFFVPVTVADLGACQIRTTNNNNNSAGNSPLMTSPGGTTALPEETSRKREIRLLKNREAAKECRRKKKEYIKCLENRVAVLENQNKQLIDELKALKELYCRKD